MPSQGETEALGQISMRSLEPFTAPGATNPIGSKTMHKKHKLSCLPAICWLWAFAPLLLKLLLLVEQEPKPPVISGFADGEVALHLAYIQEFLGDKPYLLGDRLQGPDFGMGYILQLAHRVGALEGYPALESYLGRLTGRPAFKRAMERAGE